MLKKFFLLLTVVFFSWPRPVLASGEFITQQTVSYHLDKNNAQVVHRFELENKYSKIYATNYELKIVSQHQIKEFKAFDDENNALKVKVDRSNRNVTTVKINFAAPTTGKGEKQIFRLEYQLENFIEKVGQTKRIMIPEIKDIGQFDQLEVKIIAPQDFGPLSFSSPKNHQYQKNGDKQIITMAKSSLVQKRIMLIFGEGQNLSFNLSYFLKNPDNSPGKTTIALPPDTAYQTIYLEEITPKPDNVWVDRDGNWLADYTLKGQESLQVEAAGLAYIAATPSQPPLTPQDFQPYLKEQPYWPVNDKEIKQLANQLGTVEKIYQYVVDTLSYNSTRVNNNDATRLGAKKALKNPKNAICTEFSDLFITLARAAGIPTREINGYAYSSQVELSSPGPYNDILHAWPEYWDSQSKTWRQVDPAWESTNQVDFFSKMDMTHLAFAIHGYDSQSPLPAGAYQDESNQQKTVNISFTQTPPPENCQPELELSLPQLFFPWEKKSGQAIIKNPCGKAFYEVNLETESQSFKIQKQPDKIAILPPASSRKVTLAVTNNKPWSWQEGKVKINLTCARVLGVSKEANVKKQIFKLNFLNSPILIFAATIIISAAVTFFLIKRIKA